MIFITRTHWRWLKAPISLKLGDRSDETETRTGDDFGFPISELCGREGVERVIIGHTDGTYTEYEMTVTDEGRDDSVVLYGEEGFNYGSPVIADEDGVEPENLHDYDEEEVPGSENIPDRYVPGSLGLGLPNP